MKRLTMRSKIRVCEKQLDAFSAKKRAVEIQMAASGFYDQSNANDTAVHSATLVNTDVQLKVSEKAQL